MFFFKNKKDNKKKFLIYFLSFVFVFGLIAAEPAKAQFITSNVTLDAKAIGDKINASVAAAYKNIGTAASRALMKTLKNFLNKFAQDTAIYIASGDYSKGPMWVKDSKTYWKDAGDTVAGDFIGTFGDEWALTKKFGINLCAPESPELRLSLKLSMENQLNPQPRCRLSEVTKAYERMAEPEYWDKIAVGFEPGQNGLSMRRLLDESITSINEKENAKAQWEAAILGNTKPAVDPVSKQVVTAKKTVETAMPSLETESPAATKAREVAELNKLIDGGEWLQVAKDVGGVFMDTLSNKLQETLLKKGMLSLGSLFKTSGSTLLGASSYTDQLSGTRQAAEANFAFFTKPTFSEVEDYRAQYLADLSSDCSANPSPFCGTVDDSFNRIFSLAQSGEPVTVGEALKQNLLNENWLLLGPGISCNAQSYCYDNLVKLRVLRILPIGWEMAAKLSSTQKQPLTLGQAVAQFYSPSNTTENPFYHLIDPNWLIVAPKARCAAQAYGSLTFSKPEVDVPGQRAQYCADKQDCVGEDAKTGTCNSWGYCLREKNLWRLGGDSCSSQFNTCSIYTSSSGQQASYLANTLNRGICTADNIGCRGYATEGGFIANNWVWNTVIRDSKIFFDQDVQQCSVSEEGCSGFLRMAPEVFNEPLNLKKAPSYYNCYGEGIVTTLSSSTLPWAVNKADLYKIFTNQTTEQKQQCARFAQVCSAEEKGCELYTPDNGNPAVPGILSATDQCPNECVGYETYKEQPITQFSTSTTNYFIPATAESCQSENVGCDEFVNLEAQVAGGEQKGYYTELRSCSKNETEGETFYTWEGSDTSGYQLKTYTLKKDGKAPAYNTDDAGKLTEYASACSRTVFDNRNVAGSSYNPDCRQFYGKDGTKYYKFYSKTISVSPTECQTLRKTVADLNSCTSTGGTWDATQNFCTYFSISKEAKSCPASAVGCRAYRGNAGNNFLTTYSENFESGTIGTSAAPTLGWAGQFSAEATVVGGKSLKVTNETMQVFSSEKEKTYLVYFWAKGDAANLVVQLYPSNPQGGVVTVPNSAPVSQTFRLTNEWSSYTFGPVASNWDPSVVSTTFKLNVTAGKTFYLDNFVSKIMVDNVYVIKDSWLTNPSCDNIVGDPNGESSGGSILNPLRLVPQAQLGCTGYTDRQKQAVAAKSFTNICREEAVGCEELVDTFNTPTTSSTIVNAVCELNNPSVSNQAIGCRDLAGEVRCDVLPRQKSCRFNFVGDVTALTALSGASVKDVEGQSYIVTIKNDRQTIIIPEDKKAFLVNDSRFQCSADNLGCRALGSLVYSADGSATAPLTTYLKDTPEAYDKILCEADAEGCDKYTKSTGGLDYFKDPAVFGNKLCEWKDPVDASHPYGGWVIKGTTTSCNAGSSYNVLKNNDVGYAGAVGICPSEQNGCSEFIDPVGGNSASNPAGQAYYLINNERIDKSSCQGQASLQKGCVLFNETSKGDILWTASRTYLESERKNYEKVNPVNCGINGEKSFTDDIKCSDSDLDKNNSNVILKVKRDRVCGEWLACASTMQVMKNNTPTEVCTELRLCDEASNTNSNSNELLGKCAHWVEEANTYPLKNEYLTLEKYRSYTGVETFSAKDFSGYAIPEGYQVSTLAVADSGSKFGLLGSGGKGIFEKQNTDPLVRSCRGFASVEAPKDAENLCSFTKVSYSGGDKTPIIKYYPANQLLDNTGVCDGGFNEKGLSKKGQSCVDSSDCSDDRRENKTINSSFILTASCLTSKKVERQFGWEGFCLFSDPFTKACLQWYPLSIPSNTTNIYELNQTAGYYPPEGAGKFWCTQAKGNANRSETASGYAFNLFADDPRFFPPNNGYNKGGMWWDRGSWSEKCTSGCTEWSGTTCAKCPSLQEFAEDSMEITEDENITILSKISDKPKINLAEVVAIGLYPTKIFQKEWPSSEMLIFKDQRMNGLRSLVANDAGKDARYWSGPVRALGNKWTMDLVWMESLNNAPKEHNYEDLTREYCSLYTKTNSKMGFMAFRAIFDENGILESIRTKACDTGQGDSWHSGMRMDLRFYLIEVCTDIRQVVNNDNTDKEVQKDPFNVISKARTDRIWSAGGFTLGGDKRKPGDVRFDLPYDQLNTPFGSIGRTTEPATKFLYSYFSSLKTEAEKRIILKLNSLWPVWLSPSGGTPLNCAGINGGDCGNTGVCFDGPNVGLPCKVDKNLSSPSLKNGCQKLTAQKTCTQISENICSGNIGTDKNIINIEDYLAIPCAAIDDCISKDFGSCNKDYSGNDYHCNKEPFLKCDPSAAVNPCKIDSAKIECKPNLNNFCSLLGVLSSVESNKKCDNNDQCKTSVPVYACNSANNIRGTCVGGKRHGLICAGNSDCESVVFDSSLSGKETTQNGVCVGSSLKLDTAMPTEVAPDGDIKSSKGFVRLWEIFTKTFGTWKWVDDEFRKVYGAIPANSGCSAANSGSAYCDTGTWYSSGYSKLDYSTQGGDVYASSYNSAAFQTPKPPKIYSLFISTSTVSGFTWGEENNFSVNLKEGSGDVSLKGPNAIVTLNFFAYADNDQMPLQRISIDWGDGSPAYQTRGWYKNHKPWCETIGNKVCTGINFNNPCNSSDDCLSFQSGTCSQPSASSNKRLFFGNSSGACEENYFTFKHAYDCEEGGSGWNPTTQSCKFKPKVQVLDNWGWCNGVKSATDFSFQGYWNDFNPNIDYNPKLPGIQAQEEEERGCSMMRISGNSLVPSILPWTYFSNFIEIKP